MRIMLQSKAFYAFWAFREIHICNISETKTDFAQEGPDYVYEATRPLGIFCINSGRVWRSIKNCIQTEKNQIDSFSYKEGDFLAYSHC